MQKNNINMGFETLSEVLNFLTVDELKSRAKILPVNSRIPTRKAELVFFISAQMTADKLPAVWATLDPLQQKAVCETIYSFDGMFNARQFEAKYGELPVFNIKQERYYPNLPSVLLLFLYKTKQYGYSDLVIPLELQRLCKAFIDPPAKAVINTIAELPDFFLNTDTCYEYSGEERIKLEPQAYPLIVSKTERDALQDLRAVFRLVEQGKLAISNKTLLPSLAATRQIAKVLSSDEFYSECHDLDEDIKPYSIKSFAWPLLLQAAKLAELHGTKLNLTRAGRKALSVAPEDVLKQIWTCWRDNTLFDELNRIEQIKGQRGKAKRSMTKPADRRAEINKVLRQCPIDEWVSMADFTSFLKASGHDFEVTSDPWSLYINDAQYGRLRGNEGEWALLQGRYLFCLLFEYAASLGLIDIAYVEPQQAENDFYDSCYCDIACLSRYDGLQYIRLNRLGAYCLGISDNYEREENPSKTKLTVLPNFSLQLAQPFKLDEKLFIENFATEISGLSWQLDLTTAIIAVENGYEVAELRTFLTEREEQPFLPEKVERFLTKAQKQGRALLNKGACILFECCDQKTATFLAGHEQLKALCISAGEHSLVIKLKDEKRFKKALRSLGFGMQN